MKDEIIDATIAKHYTNWHIKTGGYARDKTLRDEFAGLALQGFMSNFEAGDDIESLPALIWLMADAMLKERNK